MTRLPLILALLATPAYAQVTEPVTPGMVVETIYWSDGDSGRLDGVKFRLAGIDAPETFRPDCEAERVLGFEAKEWMVEETRQGPLVVTEVHGQDRYDRWVVSLSDDGRDLREMAIESGHARSWKHENGKAVEERPDWCGG